MAAEVDPYTQWFGIPPGEHPPDLYCLLGLRRYESDPGMIDLAAAERIAIARRRAEGETAVAARDMIDELTRARDFLLDPERRADYDWALDTARPLVRADIDSEFEDETAPQESRTAKPNDKVAVRTRSTEARLAGGEAKLGELLGAYKLTEFVERAPMALVYRGEHRMTKRPAYVKSLSAEGLASPEARMRFQREMDVLPTFDDPRFLAVLQAGFVDNRPFLAMEFANGVDLAERLTRRGPLPVVHALEYASETARGLARLHATRLAHGDVRPKAMLIDARGDLRLRSPPISRLGGGGSIRHKPSPGYEDYMPPEQAADAARVDARGDLYALGCSLFHLLVGRPPFVAKRDSEKRQLHQNAPMPSAHGARREIPPEVDFLLARMTAKKAKDRPEHCGEVVTHLARLVVKAKEAARPKSLWRSLLAKIGLSS